ncbi:Cysteine desulfurase IscS [Paraburkholderia kirstenboschensis]|uniref:hypothetical protein n=1 Tax=Paraburkholderia kirstenboschensis TaxID=1245436 RepID=UPI000A77B2F0|nr:hypothetical protein [Paraburkholderia kirstenboschensis]CAD6561040.1 Cysteine desulfurase IscS [Paraburkholderia kirstenboschensis]
MIYLDHNAIMPPACAVAQAMLSILTYGWGYASSHHAVGQQATGTLAAACAASARALGCEPAELTFTSGAPKSITGRVRATRGSAGGPAP